MAANASQMIAEWRKALQEHLPGLSKPMAGVLAMWTLGVIATGRCGLSSVSQFLAEWMGHRENTVRERLRDLYREGRAKRGRLRRSFEVARHFADLLRWVIARWQGERQIALALDATHLQQRFTVLVVSVLYQGRGIPVAWKVLKGTQAGSWRPHWKALLQLLQPAIPADWTVVVLADRGLYAEWLFEAIRRQGWHPMLRINPEGYMAMEDSPQSLQPLSTLVTQPGQSWCGQVRCFKQHPLACTLLVVWEGEEPWLLVTDLSPERAQAAWYAMRAWVEQGFRDLKRGALQWQSTRMSNPERAQRLWMVLALVALWTSSQTTGESSSQNKDSTGDSQPDPRARKRRALSCVRLGQIAILVGLLCSRLLTVGYFSPAPWATAFT